MVEFISATILVIKTRFILYHTHYFSKALTDKMTAYSGACLQDMVVLRLDTNICTFYGVQTYIAAT
jgi:hypothetical protein